MTETTRLVFHAIFYLCGVLAGVLLTRMMEEILDKN